MSLPLTWFLPGGVPDYLNKIKETRGKIKSVAVKGVEMLRPPPATATDSNAKPRQRRIDVLVRSC